MNLGPRPSLMLVICQDKPIPLVRSSLRINSSFPSPLCSFVPTVVPILERKIAAASAYINIIKSELFLMRLCELHERFLDGAINTKQLPQIPPSCLRNPNRCRNQVKIHQGKTKQSGALTLWHNSWGWWWWGGCRKTILLAVWKSDFF